MILENVSLKELNSFGFEVKARYYTEINKKEDLSRLFSAKEKIPSRHILLGGGSNILFKEDYPGLVIHMKLKGLDIVEKQKDHVVIEAQAGEDWDQLVEWTVENNLGGLENLSLIPGQAGTSPVQNIGAYGVEIKDVFHSLIAFEKTTGKFHTFDHQQCDFGYRNSIFKNKLKGQFIIIAVRFRLAAQNHLLHTEYGAIGAELSAMRINQASIADIRTAICNIRSSKLPDPSVLGNAGSFFKNPVVGTEVFQKLKDRFPDVVAYPSADKGIKLAAGWLIEKAGWKGYRRGDAGVHHKQALVLVNHGKATGNDILELAADIQNSVEELFGVLLEPEVNIV